MVRGRWGAAFRLESLRMLSGEEREGEKEGVRSVNGWHFSAWKEMKREYAVALKGMGRDGTSSTVEETIKGKEAEKLQAGM